MRFLHMIRCCIMMLTASTTAVLFSADPQPGKPPTGPLSPREELATFRVPKGFKVELVASEPDVVDPVALAFDADGRLFVAEMHGYPNKGVGTGTITSGKIKLLEDPDGKGVYSKSTVFADGLRFPTSMMPYKGGLLAAVAPDLIYLEGPDASGKSRGQRTLYTGFDLDNIQQLLNGLQWGLDNWVYGCAGGKGGTIRSAEKPDTAAVTLRGRGIRFHPEVPGSLEPMSGGGQFGLAADDGQHWFTATNSQHLRQIILPDHYLRRNLFLPVSAVTLDISDHNAACKVHRISPFEAWRVERTTQRVGDPSFKSRLPSTEQVPGGYITSACSPIVYNGGLFPEAFHHNTFVCEPANNLIHRDVLIDQGSRFVAKRADDEADCEFLASTDIWFRPVNLAIGPDGAVYVADFYREVIETPLSLPEDIKKKLNLESRGRGRIWRIVPENAKPAKKPALSKASSTELVAHLADANSWYRLTAQRLLIERQDKTAVEPLKKLAREVAFAPGRSHALWTLQGLGALDDALIETALKDPHPGVREQALRLAEERLAGSASLRKTVAGLADDPSPRVRFQLAFSLGAADAPELVQAMARLARRDGADSWTQTALLSSALRSASGLLETLGKDTDFTRSLSASHAQLLGRLATLVGAGGSETDLARALGLLGDKAEVAAWQRIVLEGLGQGLQSSRRPLRHIWEEPPPSLKDAVARAQPFFQRAAAAARDEKLTADERLGAIRLLAIGPFATGGKALQELVEPRHPADIQLAAIRALAAQEHPQVAEMLLAPWNSYSPSLRREATEALVARPDRVRKLLDAVEAKKVLPMQIEAARVELLRKHPDAQLRQRAEKLLAGRTAGDRQKIVDDYKAALDLKADADRGKLLFKKACTVCHRLENEGVEVGPDLLSALKTKTREGLLVDILDPSREVDPRYVNYVVTTKDGRVLTGMIVVDAPASITLRRAEKAEDVILRNQLDEVQATSKSLMPDELEKQLNKQELADVIEYLMRVARGK